MCIRNIYVCIFTMTRSLLSLHLPSNFQAKHSLSCALIFCSFIARAKSTAQSRKTVQFSMFTKNTMTRRNNQVKVINSGYTYTIHTHTGDWRAHRRENIYLYSIFLSISFGERKRASELPNKWFKDVTISNMYILRFGGGSNGWPNRFGWEKIIAPARMRRCVCACDVGTLVHHRVRIAP